MHAYLFTGEAGEAQKRVDAFVKAESLNRINFPLTSIKEIKELTSLAQIPFASKTAIVIYDFEKVSIEAQNAFLKTLEEPQKNLIFLLTSTSADKLLPTISSRCEIVQVQKLYKLTNLTIKLVEAFIKASEGEKLKIVSKITDRENAKIFLKNIILASKEGNDFKKITANKADQALQKINQNANPTLQLTNFVL